jgi:hypothetical protein
MPTLHLPTEIDQPPLPILSRDYRTDIALRPQPKRLGADRWPTPVSLIDALIRHVIPTLPPGPVWECAAGPGDLATALRNAGRHVVASDLHGDSDRCIDFLHDDPPAHDLAAIVTNPPFNQLDAFIVRGLHHLDRAATQALVLLLRHDAFMAAGRVDALNRASHVLGCNWRARWIPLSTASPRWAFSWVTWRADRCGPPITLRVTQP